MKITKRLEYIMTAKKPPTKVSLLAKILYEPSLALRDGTPRNVAVKPQLHVCTPVAK